MVRLYTDEEMDARCRDYRPVPMKLNKLVYGLEGVGTNPLTNTKSDRMLTLPAANINLATKSNVKLNTIPASVIEKRYNSLYQDVIIDGKKISNEEEIETKTETEFIDWRTLPRRTKDQMTEAKEMGKEDKAAEEVASVYVDPVTGEVEELMEPYLEVSYSEETVEETVKEPVKEAPKPDIRRRY